MYTIFIRIYMYNVESLEFVMTQFSWYSWEALSHKFTSSTKTIYKIFRFPTKLMPTHPRIYIPTNKQTQNPRNMAPNKI